MSLSVGIVGLPNAGKSTLFNALVKKQQAATGRHPFTTIEPNRGTIDVPSQRLEQLALMSRAQIRTPVKLTFIDIAGLIKGAHQGEGLGNQFLAQIREVDCIVQVVRGFKDSTVAHVHAKIDPDNDLEIVRMELIFKDLDTVDKQLAGKAGWIRETGAKGNKVLQQIKQGLNKAVPVRQLNLTPEEKALIQPLFFLTDKPELVVLNRGEQDSAPSSSINSHAFYDVQVCAKLEAELAGMRWTEQRQYLKEFDLPEPALERVVRACYKQLGLLTFYTIAGNKEARAWALPKGCSVYEAAGRIHTDMQRRFIKAEVINAAELLAIGSWSKAKQEGRVNLQGRNYIVQDQDVLEIKFN